MFLGKIFRKPAYECLSDEYLLLNNILRFKRFLMEGACSLVYFLEHVLTVVGKSLRTVPELVAVNY